MPHSLRKLAWYARLLVLALAALGPSAPPPPPPPRRAPEVQVVAEPKRNKKR